MTAYYLSRSKPQGTDTTATMGNICSGGKEECKKGALDALDHRREGATDSAKNNARSDDRAPPTMDGARLPHSESLTSALSNTANAAGMTAAIPSSTSTSAAEMDLAERALRQEQARCKVIVQETGRAMVPLRSTRGNTLYYDQGFAAALAQHLEQTTQFPPPVLSPLPPVPTTLRTGVQSTATAAVESTANPTNDAGAVGVNKMNTVYAILSRPEWEGITVGVKEGGLAGCGGENPAKYMDQLSEQFLDSLIPKKERLFVKALPITENLL